MAEEKNKRTLRPKHQQQTVDEYSEAVVNVRVEGDGFTNIVRAQPNSAEGFYDLLENERDSENFDFIPVNADEDDDLASIQDSRLYKIIAGLPRKIIKPAVASSSNQAAGSVEFQEQGGQISFEASEPGLYIVTKNGQTVGTKSVFFENKNSVISIRLFNDEDGDGVRDGNEPIVADISEFEVSIVKNTTTMRVNQGWNLINIPLFLSEDSEGSLTSIEKFIEEQRSLGVNILHAGVYRDGNFVMYSNRDNTEFNEPFYVLPGEGLFVFVAKGSYLKFAGYKIKEPIPLSLSTGWNLIGVVSPDKSYTSESLLDSMQKEGIKSDVVSRFNGGIYQNVIKEDGVLYGNNFDIIDTEGYFLRVKEGGKTWTP